MHTEGTCAAEYRTQRGNVLLVLVDSEMVKGNAMFQVCGMEVSADSTRFSLYRGSVPGPCGHRLCQPKLGAK